MEEEASKNWRGWKVAAAAAAFGRAMIGIAVVFIEL